MILSSSNSFILEAWCSRGAGRASWRSSALKSFGVAGHGVDGAMLAAGVTGTESVAATSGAAAGVAVAAAAGAIP